MVATGSPTAVLAVDRANNPTIILRKNDFDSTFPGIVASRTASGWSNEPTPFGFGGAVIGFDPAGTLHALVIAGDPNIRYVAHDPSGWSSPVIVPDVDLFIDQLWAPSAGCLLTGVTQRSQVAMLENMGASWLPTPLSSDGSSMRGGLAQNGRPEYAWIDYDGSASPPLTLKWQAPPNPSEVVPVPNAEQTGAALVGVVGADGGIGQPHLLFKQGIPPFESNPGTSRLMHATRSSSGVWTTAAVVSDDLGRPCYYQGTPPPGTMCTSTSTVNAPIAVLVSDNGDVRLLFITSVRETMLSVDASGTVTRSSSTLSEQLQMAWPDGSGFGSTTLFDTDKTASLCAGDPSICAPARAVVDSAGTIHVVVIGAGVRYVALAQ